MELKLTHQESKDIERALTKHYPEYYSKEQIVEAVEFNIDICSARIAQHIRHSNTALDPEVYNDFVVLLNEMLYLYKLATGEMHYIESLDHTDY